MAIGMQYERHIVNLMQPTLTKFFDEIGVRYKLVTGKRITLSNGSRILFGSADKPSSLEGPHLQAGVWIDEAGLMGRQAWEVATRRSGYHSAPIFITTIPYLPHWLKTEVYEPFLKGDPSITWIHCRSIDNPDYPLEEIERRKRVMRPEKFATYYLGEFSRPYGAIYPEPDDADLLVSDFEIPDSWPCYSGHDWGFTAPTTGIWARHDLHGEGPTGIPDTLYIVAEYQMRGDSIEQHVERWQQDGLDAVDEAWGDSANPEIWYRSGQLGYPVGPVVKGEKSVAWGINVGYERMRSGRLKVFRSCRAFMDYRRKYVWDTSTTDDEALLEKPKEPQEAEHLMDAYRYLCVGLIDSGISAAPPEMLAYRRTLAA